MSSMLLEILGRAVNIDTAELIQHWFNAVRDKNQDKWLGEYKELNKVVDLVGEQKFEKAHEQLRFYLFENPTCTKGRLAAGQLCLYDNQLKDAVEQFNSVYFREPTNTMALYALGHCYERLGRESEAIEFYQDCLKFKNYLQLPRQRLAAIYYKNSQIEKTTFEYEELRKEYPDDISVLVTLGYLYMLHCKNEAAIDAFNSAILIHPDNFQGQEDEIDELIRSSQFDDAIDMIDRQFEEEPYRIDLILKKGDIYNMLGQNHEAIEEYQKAIKIRPDFLEATIKLGTSYLQTQQDELAAMEYNNALEINDRIVDAYMGLAIAQKAAGKMSEATSTLSLAVAIVPNSSTLFTETAKLQFKINMEPAIGADNNVYGSDITESVICAHKQHIMEKPNDSDLYYRFGILMMSVERTSEAIKSFRKALVLNPMHTRAKCKLCICMYESGEEREAIANLPQEKCLDKESLDLHYKTALLYCDKVKFASSLINLERAIENNYTSCDAAVNISVILQNLGLLNRATAMWDNLLDTAEVASRSRHHLPPNQF